jgi:ribosomal protein S18 acetylase RimI-like enzyme
MSEPSLRPATGDDAPRLSELVRNAYRHYVERIGSEPRPMTDDYAEVIHDLDVTVATEGRQIVGVLVLDESSGRFTIDNVAVAPEHQGKGVGRALLSHAEAEAARAGHDSIHLFTHELMTENLALYERIGYEEYERRHFGTDTLVFLSKHLRRAAE